MPIQEQRVTVKVKQNPNNSVTVETREHLGVGGVKGDSQVGARSMGIPGPAGPLGPIGPPGETGPRGINWRGTFDPSQTYNQYDAVFFNVASYICVSETPITGEVPAQNQYWNIIAGASSAGATVDLRYTHNQNIAHDEWMIQHWLGKFPSVSVVDSGGSQVEGDVEYIDENSVIIRFSGEFTGKAYLN